MSDSVADPKTPDVDVLGLARGMDNGLRQNGRAPAGSNNNVQPGDGFADRIEQALKKLRNDGQTVQADDPAGAVPGSSSESATVPSTGPVGVGEHVVKQGECVSSIAKIAGHSWETIWNDPANNELREVRRDPNVLLPDDRVHVPPLREKWEPGQTEMRHRFRRRGWPEVLRIRVLRDSEPRGNQPYTLDVDGTRFEGVTDAGGNLNRPILPDARRAVLRVGVEPEISEYLFALGAIDPLSEISGVQGRLNNLGFGCGPIDGVLGERTAAALCDYQHSRGLPITGDADQATRRKLQTDYGC